MDPEKIKKIGVIGAGTIGSGWATFFVMKGYHVKLQDINKEILARGIQRIRSNVEFLAKRGLLEDGAVESTLSRITETTNLKEAVSDADYVQESTFESYDMKKRIFKEMDSVCPSHAILASSSSGLLMTEIQKVTNKPERCTIAHPFNPPHLMPLVEIVPGRQTSERTARKVYDFFVRLGKVPVLLKKEVPGYIANRLSAALWREAIDLVNNDVATVEDVDKALSAGPGLRWALMGPHMTYHLGGGKGGIEYFVDHLGPAFESWWRSMNTRTSIPDSSVKKVVDGVKDEMGTRTWEDVVKWRDDKLIELLKIIYQAGEEHDKTGVLQAIKKRRSIRRYKPDDVSDSDLNIVLEAARWAPSWANTQCWEFVVVRNKDLKAKLSNTLSIHNPASLAIRQAPIVIVACAHREKSGYFKGKPVTDKGDWFMFDMALAMQNLALAAYALGLGTVHVGYFDAQKVADVIDIPEEMTVVELMPLGYPDEEPKAPPRKELSEIVSYDKFESFPTINLERRNR